MRNAGIAAHAILNRRMLLNYVRGHDAHPEIAREAVAAIMLVALMLSFAVGDAFP